jgi:tol-pal system protein YbgF
MTTPGGTVVAATPPNAPPVNALKEEFDVALGYYKQKDYDAAERSFTAFVQKNPKTRYSAEAVYYLGESYYVRGRQREAAEQYLKISTDYANSSRAPEALIRLGQSLHALGAKEQACASFSEVGRKYPNASAAVKAAAEREAKRFQCG